MLFNCFLNTRWLYTKIWPLHAPPKGESRAYRNIGTGSQILKALGVRKMRLLSSPMKFNALSGFDLEIVEYVEADG